jgi:hypothetical protein
MKDQRINRQDEKNDKVNPIVFTKAGAAIGGRITVAEVALSDNKNREKVIKATTARKDDVVSYVVKTQKQIEAQKKINQVINSAKNSLHKTTKEINKALKSL